MTADYQNPYGLNPPDAPVADRLVAAYQGDNTVIYRNLKGPGGEPVTKDNCRLVFSIVDRRFKRRRYFRADWDKGIEQTAGPGRVKITIPTRETMVFLRGSLLYSITWYDKLRSRRAVLEEGGFLIEYSADAPNPEVPYNIADRSRQEQTYHG